MRMCYSQTRCQDASAMARVCRDQIWVLRAKFGPSNQTQLGVTPMKISVLMAIAHAIRME